MKSKINEQQGAGRSKTRNWRTALLLVPDPLPEERCRAICISWDKKPLSYF